MKLVILGGHGDGIVVAQAAQDSAAAHGYGRVVGFLNDRLAEGELIYGHPVLGTLQSWRRLSEEIHFVPALHKVGEMESRSRLLRELGIPGERWASVIHPSACIASDVAVGYGSFVASHVTIQPGAKIGRFVSIRAGANVGHDAVIEDFAYVGPNATLSGRSRLAEGAHLAPNAAVVDRVTVGRYAVIGICSAVMKDVEEFSVYLGSPARKLRSLRREEENNG